MCPQLARICRGRSTVCFIYNFVIQELSEKNTVQQRFYQQFERHFYMKIIVTIIATNIVTNLLLSIFFSFLTNQKQEYGFQQVGGLVRKNIFVFCLQPVALYFKTIPNSVDFCEGIFLHVIPVRIIFPCLKHTSKQLKPTVIYIRAKISRLIKKLMDKINRK